MVKRWVAALIVIAACTPAWAIDAEGDYVTRGIGNELCAAFNSARDTHRDAEFTAWLAGYLSGFDRWTSDVYDIEGPTGFDGAMRWLDYYCHVHPQMPFSLAAEGLIAFLYPARARRAPAASVPGSGAGSSRPPQ